MSKPGLGLLFVLLLVVLHWERTSEAAGVAILTDSRVAQYREALTAAKEVLRESTVFEVGADDVGSQLERALPAVILAIGQKALGTVASKNTPVIFCMVLGSSATGSAKITGLRLEVAPEAQLQQFKRVHPGAKRLGVIYDSRTWSGYLVEATRAATGLGITLIAKPVTDGKAVRAALEEMVADIDALWLFPDPQLITADMFNFLLLSTLERKVALFGFFESFTRAGALASMAPDYSAIGRQAAKLAADLAAKPAEARLPVPAPVASPGVLTINLKTARLLGLDVSEDVQAKAKQVYR